MFGTDFTQEHVKNYIKLYGAIVVIMILFFIAAKLYYKPQKVIAKKEFDTAVAAKHTVSTKEAKQSDTKSRLKLLDKTY